LFFNPSLPTDVSRLTSDPFDIDSKTVRIGIGTTVRDTDLTNGNTILQLTSGAQGNLVGTAGTAKGDLTIINSGIGYTPSSGSQTFNNLILTNVESSGRNATANITINNGVAIAATILNGGTGYSVGDVLTVSSIGISSVGRNLRLSVSELNGINELIVTDVQGEFVVGAGYTIQYVNNSGITTNLNGGFGGNVTLSSPEEIIFDGLHAKVLHRNHGMHSDVNQVVITGAKSSVTPTTLATNYSSSSTSDIVLSNSANFSTFEGVSTSRGYLKVNNEIIFYNNIDGGSNSLTIGNRGVDNTVIRSHNSGDFARKYEIGNFSLRKNNTTLDLPTSSSNPTLKNLTDLDSYYLEFNRGDRSYSDNQLSFSDEKVVGGSSVNISQNYQYSSIIPQFNIITPGNETSVSALLRTVSGTSASGTELSFVDQGYENIQLNSINYLNTPRLVCSEINESTRLSSLPRNKSITLNILMERSANNADLSPVIDLQTAYMTFGRNRLNTPISNYALDSRVNIPFGDPHSSIYISNRIDLKQTATSLKVLVSACRPFGSDFRVLYKLFRSDLSESLQSYILFPGYDNLKDTDNDGFGDVVIDASLNTGNPDAKVGESSNGEFLEYQFTADNLEPFSGFVIKIVMSSTNESSQLKFKDLRAIALA
jgi:hypothetical protein